MFAKKGQRILKVTTKEGITQLTVLMLMAEIPIGVGLIFWVLGQLNFGNCICVIIFFYHFSTVIDFSSEKYSGSTGHRNSWYQ